MVKTVSVDPEAIARHKDMKIVYTPIHGTGMTVSYTHLDVYKRQASYRGTIDGEYALFGRPNIVKSYWECVLDPKRVKKMCIRDSSIIVLLIKI